MMRKPHGTVTKIRTAQYAAVTTCREVATEVPSMRPGSAARAIAEARSEAEAGAADPPTKAAAAQNAAITAKAKDKRIEREAAIVSGS
mmetsp:Transcript_67846/g.194874  ORF Transcript_67846/g.194874 Transcript_67846/m.194874 type:complete len:88 (+) Transcript_67846:368-631(+)